MPEDFQLQDIAPAEPYLLRPDLPWWAWLLIAHAVLLLAGLLAAIVYAVRAHRAESRSLPHDRGRVVEAAYREARLAIDKSDDEETPAALATRISAALRRYLATACGDPSLFETHEEFLARHEALSDLPGELRQDTAAHFTRLARVKYDKNRSDDPAPLRAEALALLETLHRQTPA